MGELSPQLIHHRRQIPQEIAGDHPAWPDLLFALFPGPAMQPRAQASRIKSLQPMRQQTGDRPGQDIARPSQTSQTSQTDRLRYWR